MGQHDAEDQPRRLTRAENRARTRELLLDAAARVFARKGYTAASVEEIAESAGFSVGAVYSNFAGKQQLFAELMAHRASERIEQVSRSIDVGAPGSDEPLHALGRVLVDVADNDIDYEAIESEFWLHGVRNPEAMQSVLDRSAGTLAAVRDILAAALKRHDVDDSVSPDAFAVVALALFQGLIRQRRIDPARVPEELFGQALAWQIAGMPKASPTSAEASSHE